jgi:hypothetical protein
MWEKTGAAVDGFADDLNDSLGFCLFYLFICFSFDDRIIPFEPGFFMEIVFAHQVLAVEEDASFVQFQHPLEVPNAVPFVTW